MGHRSSKSSAASATGNTTNKSVKANRLSSASTQSATHRQSNLIPVPPVINLQFQESSNTSSGPRSKSSNDSLTSTSNSYPRQIIIKIQLTKMENGQHESHDQQAAQAPEVLTANFRDYYATDANSNQLESSNSPTFDLRLNRNYMFDEHTSGTTSTATTTTAEVNRAAGSSTTAAAVAASSLSANYNRRTLMGRMNAMQLSTRSAEESTAEAAEYCEVLEEGAATSILSSAFRKVPHSGSTNASRRSAGAERKDGDSARRAKNRSSFSSLKRMLEASGSKSNKNKDRQEHNNNDQQHSKSSQTYPVLSLTTPERQQQQRPCCSTAARGAAAVVNTSASASISTSTPISITSPPAVGASSTAPNQLSIRTQNNTDVIIPFSSPQFVVVCPTTSLVTVGRFDNNGISLMTTEIGGSSGAESTITTVHSNMVAKNAPSGPIVHSQVDFVHCLVPDLVRIFNSSFYWGKMDRYEAERLLEGKPEGTFLLRDSAQEEYLFSVTFRKYERSLHARIEQSGHKFSFDCHDPCVFTAPTVTGLLEHYKDPSCVMFFEPMLTIPFHRKAPFSLQQLARATIVSNTTYDGISELELPMRLKVYLKEYHYKQKLRVKPFDESFFACT